MSKNLKQLYKEIFFIIAISIVLGLLYNQFSPLQQKKKKTDAAKAILNKNKYNSNQNAIQDTVVQVNNFSFYSHFSRKSNLSLQDSISLNKDESKAINSFVVDNSKDGNIPEISYSKLMAFINDPDLYLIDARAPEQYSKGRIGNAVNIYPYLEETEYIQKLASVPENKIIIVYCDGGDCDLSHKVVADLVNFGHKKMMLYPGGWDEWSKKTGS